MDIRRHRTRKLIIFLLSLLPEERLTEFSLFFFSVLLFFFCLHLVFVVVVIIKLNPVQPLARFVRKGVDRCDNRNE